MSETCYGHSSPNAVFLPNYGPCNPQAGSISLCCEIGQTCLVNGLCVTQSGVYYSGGCTDSTYKAAICPTFCTSGDANWVIECHGSAVKDGDFCCSVNGTTTTCCNTASNGLGLIAAVSSAQAVSATSVEASTVPTATSSGATTSSTGSIATSLTPTSSPTATSLSPSATSRSHGSTRMTRRLKIDIGIGISAVFLAFLFGTAIFPCIRRWWIQRQLERHRPRGNEVELNDYRREGTDRSGPQAQPTECVIPTEFEGSQAGPVEMDANPPPYST